MDDLKYLTIPVLCDSKLKLPYLIFENVNFQILLDSLSRKEIEKAFRIKYIDKKDGSYEAISTKHDYIDDEKIFHALHEAKLQIRIIPKQPYGVDQEIKERAGQALNVALGLLDEFSSWQYSGFSTVNTKVEYRSYKSALRTSLIDEVSIEKIRVIIEYVPTDKLPKHRFDTLLALIYSASHQGSAIDVSCVLYLAILEAIYVKDDKELSYKLSMRIAAELHLDSDFAEHIRKLYSKRGKVIHGSNKGDVFTNDDHYELEVLAKDALIRFVENPTSFEQSALDKLLLTKRLF